MCLEWLNDFGAFHAWAGIAGSYEKRLWWRYKQGWAVEEIFYMAERESSNSSYANRGKHYVRGHYSREGGRSGMMDHLEAALSSAAEQDRENLMRFIRKLENA